MGAGMNGGNVLRARETALANYGIDIVSGPTLGGRGETGEGEEVDMVIHHTLSAPVLPNKLPALKSERRKARDRRSM